MFYLWMAPIVTSSDIRHVKSHNKNRRSFLRTFTAPACAHCSAVPPSPRTRVPAWLCAFRCTPVLTKNGPVRTSPWRRHPINRSIPRDCHVFGEIGSRISSGRVRFQPITAEWAGLTRADSEALPTEKQTEKKKKSRHYANPSNGGGPGR